MAGADPCISPSVVLVMGASGAGKTSVARLLAERLGVELLDADALHSKANVRKMESGVALTDKDRRPWLEQVARRIGELRAAGRPVVVACSALRRAYRELLIGGREDARLVYLKGDARLLGERMKLRQGHFMPASLLQSQLATLEEPQADEQPIAVAIDQGLEAIVAEILGRLQARPA